MEDYKTRIKKTFVERFTDLKKKEINGKEPTIEKIAEALGVSDSSIYKWLNPDDLTIPWKSLYTICDFYGVDPEHLLLPGYKNFTIEYDRISEITGLSSKSIAALQKFQKRSEDDNEAIAWKNTAIINEILEGLYNSDSCESFLTMVYDYTHPDDISSPNNKHEKYSAGMVKLIRGSLMDDIQSWLHLHVKKKPKDELMSFSSPEEYNKWLNSKQKKTATEADQ